jgi:hypothetical protein
MHSIKKTMIAGFRRLDLDPSPNRGRSMKLKCCIMSNKLGLLATTALLVYYLAMDVALYSRAKQRHVNHEPEPAPSPLGSVNVFYPLTVKKIMMCESTHYVRSPLAELVEDVFGFSVLFPFISANAISLAHCLLSLFCMKLLSHKNLWWRQMGVCLFQFRNFLDSFDGVVYRAHAKHKYAYKSVYGSYGYFIDAVSDVFGGICLTVAIALYLLKNPPPKRNQTKCFDFNDAINNDDYAPLRSPSNLTIVVSVALVGIRLALSGLFWDRSVHAYEDLLDSNSLSALHEVCPILAISFLHEIFDRRLRFQAVANQHFKLNSDPRHHVLLESHERLKSNRLFTLCSIYRQNLGEYFLKAEDSSRAPFRMISLKLSNPEMVHVIILPKSSLDLNLLQRNSS